MQRPTRSPAPTHSTAATRASRPLRGALALACGAVLLAGVTAGCDDAATASERQVRAAIAEANTTVASQPEKAAASLRDAAADDSAPPASRVQANDLLATAEYRQASALAETAAAAELVTLARAADLARLSQQLALGNAFASGYQKFDPATAATPGGVAPLATLDEKVKGVQTGDMWSPAGLGETVKIPTLEAVRAEIERLTKQVGEKDQQSQQLDGQRANLVTQADSLSQRSEQSTGQSSVDAFKQASDLRKRAGDLATEKEVVDAAAEPLRADLAVARAQEVELSAAVDALQAQRQAAVTGWQAVQQQIAVIKSVGQSILGDGGASSAPAASDSADSGDVAQAGAAEPQTVEGMVAALARSVDARDDAATRAAELFASSASHYEAAARAAGAFATDVSSQTASLADASASPLTAAAKALDPGAYTLRQALAELERARVLTGRAAATAAVLTASQALDAAIAAGGYQPVDGQPDLKADASELALQLKAAEEAYDAAQVPIENLTGGRAAKEVVDAARAVKVYALYGQALLARTQVASGVGDLGQRRVDDLLNAAAAAATEARANTPTLVLPAELADRAPAATPDAAPDAASDAASEATTDESSGPRQAPPAGENDGNE